MKRILLILFLLICSPLYAGEYLGEFQIGDTVYFSAAFNDTTGTRYENTASVAGRLYRGGTYVAAPAWAELDDANLVGVWQASQDTTGYTAGQYTMAVWGTIDSSKVPQKTLTFNLYAATGKQVDVESLGGVAQSLTDLKDFADAGYNPATDKITGVLLVDTTSTLTGHTVQTGDSYAIVNSGTHGNSALKTLIDTVDNYVDTEVAAILLDTGTTLDALIKDIPTVAEFNARSIVSADYVVVGDTLAGVTTVTNLTNAPTNGDLTATMKTSIETAVNNKLVAQKLDHLIAVADSDDPVDGSIIAKLASSNATADWSTFASTTDSLQAIRDRGDSAWTTGGGGSISDILNIRALIPNDIDLANTATVRLSLGLTNMLDDLPSTAEVTPGTITIDRKAIGGTSWTNVVNAAACSEVAGLVYYDEVFDSGTGYAEGDSIRITFKSQKITVAANDYEITGTDGWIFQTSIRQTMKGTDNAAPATTALSNATWTDAKAGYLDEAISGIDDNPWDAVARTLTDKAGFTISGTTQTLDALSTHGDSTWATATGFSTHDAAAVWSVGTRSLTDKAEFSLSATGIDSIIDEEVDNDGTAISLRGATKLMLSVLTGKSDGGGTATLTFRDLGDTKNRISATVTSVGNRTAVTRDAQ